MKLLVKLKVKRVMHAKHLHRLDIMRVWWNSIAESRINHVDVAIPFCGKLVRNNFRKSYFFLMLVYKFMISSP